jgi:hypothetical protein
MSLGGAVLDVLIALLDELSEVGLEGLNQDLQNLEIAEECALVDECVAKAVHCQVKFANLEVLAQLLQDGHKVVDSVVLDALSHLELTLVEELRLSGLLETQLLLILLELHRLLLD